MKSVGVFCSASSDVSPFFHEEMAKLAQGLVGADFQIVYGGATCGLMGRLADEALNVNGKVVGVMPDAFKQEKIHNGLTQLKIVDDLSDRKKQMLELSDAFIVFPGGIGTLDEAIEMICYKSIGVHSKPILFLNYMGFWEPFFDVLGLIREQRMISRPLSEYYHVVDTSADAVRYLEKALGQRDYGISDETDSSFGMAP